MAASESVSDPAVRDSIFNNSQAFWWDAARPRPFETFIYPTFKEAPHPQQKGSGKRRHKVSKDRRGTYYKAQPAGNDLSDIAFDATIRAAAVHQQNQRNKKPDEPAIVVQKADLMKKVRIHTVSNLLVFLVDLSWSMAVTQRMNATKGAILTLLTDAYQQRDSVALITFQKDSATTVIAPTRSVMLAERSMKQVAVGGKTPLAAGLIKAHETLCRERQKDPDQNMLLIALTDGAANISMFGGDPMEEAKSAAEKIAADGFHSIVINTESITFDQEHANKLAEYLNAPCHLIANIKSDSLYKTVRKELQQG